MTPLHQAPFAQFNVLIELGTAGPQAGFQDVSGLSGDAGASKVVTLKRGGFRSQAFEEWVRAIRDGKYDRPVTIRLQAPDRGAVTAWRVVGARIIKHTSGPMNAKGTDVAMEELVLGYERLEME